MKKKKFLQSKQGDSIIEVLLAVAIFSAIAVTSVAIMNKGLASAQTALESTMVRTELDAQAEAIRFIEQAYETNAGGSIGRLWSTIVENAIFPDASTADSDYNKLKAAIDGNNACPTSTDLPNKYFLYDNSRLEPNPNLNTSSIPSVANGGLWVVAVKNNSEDDIEKIEYFDFYISACWDALNSPMPAKRTTIIRLHNPDYETTSNAPESNIVSAPLWIKINNDSDDTISVSKGGETIQIEGNSNDNIKYKPISWEAGTTKTESTQIDLNQYKPTRNGYDFDGWNPTPSGNFSYTCVSDGYGNNTCNWVDGELTFTPTWKPQENKFALKYDDHNLNDDTYSGMESSRSFTLKEPSIIPTNMVFVGWNIDDSIRQPGSTVSVSTSDSTDSNNVHYKTAKAVLAEKHRIPTLAYGNIFSVTMTFPCARGNGLFGWNPFNTCATDENNMRKYSIQLHDMELNSNKMSTNTYTSYEEFSNKDIVGAFYKENDNNYELNIIRKKENTNTEDSRRIEALINVDQLEPGRWYVLQVHSASVGIGKQNDALGLINNIKITLNCYTDKEGNCGSTGRTYKTSGIEDDVTQDYPVIRIRKNEDGKLEIIDP